MLRKPAASALMERMSGSFTSASSPFFARLRRKSSIWMWLIGSR
ncbi:hypothetical protein HMPREF9080_01408 [Cardiobacterium valvarum F0432]|uniref:Uncharacterized protein n=1 Tax=Cardiobacterium valvarum F0432 TaxID=797473 RepID=G9ZF53_9GAMM|nr:hypothetical protein HMPREF9080_01408 [Cardiobacterium valvarum F0432]